MREWNLRPGDPLTLTLAADARLGPTLYCDDQIWELALGGGEPPALALQTTFGLRARALRLFPRFTEGDICLTNPAEFARAPVLTHIYPNLLHLTCSPFHEIDVEIEYWVPQSQGVAGRVRVMNSSSGSRTVRLEWVGQLTPTEGQRMAVTEIHAAPVLAGQTDGLAPVVFITGGPQAAAGSYPALQLDLELPAGGIRQLIWSQAALESQEASFTLARSLAARNLEAERARLDLLNAGLVDIYTGNPDWDAAFALAQKTAYNLFVGPTGVFPHPSFVLARQPDHGNSLRGDGSDYNYLWNGQPPLEALYLAGLVLPAAPALMEGIVRNALSIQAEDGSIDWKPGLAGQRSRMMATPVLATLAWKIYETTGEHRFLEDVFPGLLRFLQAWFQPEHDRDGDGIPEWDQPVQMGMDDHPIYSRWQEWAQGVEISSSEGPALCAFLYRECLSNIEIARTLDLPDVISELQAKAERLQAAVEQSWDPNDHCYHDWDRDSHFSNPGAWLGQRQGPGEIFLDQRFEQPVRLLVRIQSDGEYTRRPEIFVHGAGVSDQHRIERFSDDRVKWYLGIGNLTGDRVYTSLEKVVIGGIDPKDLVTLYSAGYNALDQSLLLPLWAGIPDEDRARRLVEAQILAPERFWRPYGLPASLDPLSPPGAAVFHTVDLPWNSLIGSGLIRYGYHMEAAELVNRLMTGVIRSLKESHGFRRYIHAETGQGFGERNALQGIAPIGLFLETLGVRSISPRRVELAGFNPFPWPVTVKYRGLTVMRQKEKTVVIFPDGQAINIDEPAPRIITLE